MLTPPPSITNSDKFFDSISGWRSAYINATMHYLGIRNSLGELILIRSRVFLNGFTPRLQDSLFKCRNIEAGQFEINQNEISIELLLQKLISADGYITEDLGVIRLIAGSFESLNISEPVLLHPEGLDTGNRLSVLTISGCKIDSLISQPDTDWTLKSSDTPYDSINELFNEYGLGGNININTTLEIVARNIIEIWANSSIEGEDAKLGVWLTKNVDKNLAKIGYRVLSNGQVMSRSFIPPSELTWKEEEHAFVGTKMIKIPSGAILQCIASYNNTTHHVAWRADPKNFQNSRSAAHNLVDPNQSIIKSSLFPDLNAKVKNADDFEYGVNWLLWALGFSPNIYGTHAKTRNGLDIIATTPSGNFLVVECTLGILKAENKLAKLSARANQLRQSLDNSNLKNLKILPVIVTALPREQIEVDIPAAEENGVLVIAKQDIEVLFNMFLWFPNPENLYSKAIAKTDELKASRKSVNGGVF